MTKPIRRELFLAEVARRMSGALSEATCAAAGQKTEVSHLPMDYEQAVQEFGGEKALLEEVVESFLKIARTQLDDMDKSIEACDAAALGREAHKIKGASANITAMRLSEAAKAIEEKCKSGDLSGIEEVFAGLKREVESLGAFAGNGYNSVAGRST